MVPCFPGDRLITGLCKERREPHGNSIPPVDSVRYSITEINYRRDAVAARATTEVSLIHMKRREFIGIAAAGAAAVVVPAFARAGRSDASALAHPRLLEILHDDALVRDLGRRYREIAPAENNADVLADAIVAGPCATWSTRPSSGAIVSAHVEELVKHDFAAGQTVTLNGWILSVTEARQCALFSLSA
jgi:hypothetical protein